jgi:protocatechuate 3,4-dioxygenase beta subunit
VVELAEGPFYKSGSPQRTELVETGVAGIPFTLTGYVFDKNCTPIAGAWIDFWQADGNGSYDNADYKLRGYQLTDEQGKYTLHTVFPGLYPGRTNHIHVKLSKSQSLAGSESAGSIVTSQIFFPGASQNSTDSIFDESMVVTLSQGSDGQYAAFFNFKINQ